MRSLPPDGQSLEMSDASVRPDANQALDCCALGGAEVVADGVAGLDGGEQLGEVERTQLGGLGEGRGADGEAQRAGARLANAVDFLQSYPEVL